jgi:hypothetical protein
MFGYGSQTSSQKGLTISELIQKCPNDDIKACLQTLEQALIDGKPLRSAFKKIHKYPISDALLFVIKQTCEVPDTNIEIDDDLTDTDGTPDPEENHQADPSISDTPKMSTDNDTTSTLPQNTCGCFIKFGRTPMGCWRWTKEHQKSHPKMCQMQYLFGNCRNIECKDRHFTGIQHTGGPRREDLQQRHQKPYHQPQSHERQSQNQRPQQMLRPMVNNHREKPSNHTSLVQKNLSFLSEDRIRRLIDKSNRILEERLQKTLQNILALDQAKILQHRQPQLQQLSQPIHPQTFPPLTQQIPHQQWTPQQPDHIHQPLMQHPQLSWSQVAQQNQRTGWN